ncbi:MAG TPA: glycosyltransferase [Verrucomicrobiae bacterium]|nr:glycosyltransferase [Verrucomicrobiae bacterium]
MISFIVPAHNEEAWVGRCVSAIRGGLESLAEPHEIIVVDDASSDATASTARQQGAQVIRVERRQIAAARNAGARRARGDILFFVDADTLVNPTAIQSALRSLRAGAVGGGCLPRFEGWLPWWWRLGLPVMERLCRCLNVFPSGACLFCTRVAFQASGGFDESYYAMEDCVFVRALKRQGRFAIPAETVITSGRKLRAHSFMSYSKLFMRLTLLGPRGVRSRRGLEFWYGPEREKPEGFMTINRGA